MNMHFMDPNNRKETALSWDGLLYIFIFIIIVIMWMYGYTQKATEDGQRHACKNTHTYNLLGDTAFSVLL